MFEWRATTTILAAGIFACTFTPRVSYAQADQRTEQEPDQVICMVRPLANIPQIARERRGQPMAILATERGASELSKNGFVKVGCTATTLGRSRRAQESWRDEICELAATGNEAVQNQLTRAYGEQPAVLCAFAEIAAGPKDRTEKTADENEQPRGQLRAD